jgi:iron complex outermembrane receptor protein
MQKKGFLISTTSTCLIGFLLSSAHGQASGQTGLPVGDAAPPPAQVPSTSAGSSAPSASAVATTNDEALGEVVVTAERRSENIQKVPIAISAVTSTTLANAGITDIGGVQALVPSFMVTSDSGYAIAYLRGIGTEITGVNETSVATFVDGVYYSAPTSSVFSFNNIDQVEVLKGPQGTLFGRNATGGVIQIITREPSSTPTLDASIGYGNYGTAEGSLYASTGVAPNLAGDIAVQYHNQNDGWGYDPTTQREVNLSRDIEVRSKWKWTPGDTTKVTMAIDYGRYVGDIGLNQAILPGTIGQGGYTNAGFYNTLSNIVQGSTVRQWGASVTINQDLGNLHLVSISAYRDSLFNVRIDQDATPLNIVDAAWTQPVKAFSQEFQLLSPVGNRLQWIAGAYLFRQHSGWLPFDLSGAAADPFHQISYDFEDRLLSLAGFGQATYEVFDATKLTVGLRYTSDRHDDSGVSFADGQQVNAANPSVTFSKPTWRLSLDHQFTPNTLAYISDNRGFKGGVINQGDYTGPPVKPEVLDAYEIGVKTTVSDRLRFNAAGYFYNYKNVQIQTLLAGTPVWLNGADAHMYGVDADMTFQATNRLQFQASAGYLHGRYVDFPGYVAYVPTGLGGDKAVTIDAAGQQTVRSPTFTGDVTANYLVPTSFGSVNLSTTYSHSSAFTWQPDGRLKQPQTDLVNASILWTIHSKYDMRLWGKNITNQHYFDSEDAEALGDFGRAAAPRTYGVTLGVHLK